MKFDKKTLKAFIGEFLCTFIFIFTICANGLSDGRAKVSGGSVSAGISTAFVATALIYCFGVISGAHFNPAVTFGAMLGGKIDIIVGLIYIVLQVLAAIGAVGALSYIFPGVHVSKALVLNPPADVSVMEAFTMEAILTFFLVFVIFGTAMGVKTAATPADIESQEEMTELLASNKQRLNFAPIAIGFTLGFLCFLGGNISGGAFNPARATGPAIISTSFSNLWIYWGGDLAGAAAAVLIYRLAFER